MASPANPPTKTKILVIGGGIGGLTLGILLERAGIDYLILERTPMIRPIGSAIALSSVVQPLFLQLGLLDEIHASSKPISGMTILDESDQSLIGNLTGMKKGADTKERYGYYTRVMPRPTLYNIMLAKIPKHRLLLNKKVSSFEEYVDKSGNGDGGVIVECVDGSKYDTQILIGADGAYSTVRNTMYTKLKEQGKLPEPDQLPLRLRQHCVLGVTEPLTETEEGKAKYQGYFDNDFSEFRIVLTKDRKYMSWVMPTTDGRICWLVNRYYEEKDAEIEESTSSKTAEKEWGHEAAMEMLQEVRKFKCPHGGTIGDFVDRTPPHLISKAMLEEKLFQTWYHGRTVMIGDAIHKLIPFSGEGGAQAILDAVTLANVLYDVPTTSSDDITSAFKRFQDDRFPVVQGAIEFSKALANVFTRRGWIGDLIRKIALGNTPAFVMRKLDDQVNDKRPQAIYLPIVDVPGLVKPRAQIPSKRRLGEGPLAAKDGVDLQAATV